MSYEELVQTRVALEYERLEMDKYALEIQAIKQLEKRKKQEENHHVNLENPFKPYLVMMLFVVVTAIISYVKIYG